MERHQSSQCPISIKNEEQSRADDQDFEYQNRDIWQPLHQITLKAEAKRDPSQVCCLALKSIDGPTFEPKGFDHRLRLNIFLHRVGQSGLTRFDLITLFRRTTRQAAWPKHAQEQAADSQESQ